ncbi:hypothetical protein JOD55_000777 [Arcanobacterium pluranimalium]|nr:hypothetical protein [Arcanobacterium pluranimalium]
MNIVNSNLRRRSGVRNADPSAFSKRFPLGQANYWLFGFVSRMSVREHIRQVNIIPVIEQFFIRNFERLTTRLEVFLAKIGHLRLKNRAL